MNAVVVSAKPPIEPPTVASATCALSARNNTSKLRANSASVVVKPSSS